MGLISFIKDAGEKLFGSGKAAAAEPAGKPGAPAPNIDELNRAAADAIQKYVEKMGLTATGLTITYNAGEVTVYGVAPDQETKEKIVLCCGNVASVEKVNDMMTVDQSAPEAQYYTVVRGDTLSKIAKQYYGNANQYMPIFEANKPMLTHPDKIYPGQVLRIPPQ
jgi:nucleoid-associated protein YgaU